MADGVLAAVRGVLGAIGHDLMTGMAEPDPDAIFDELEKRLRQQIAADIAAFADDDSDVSDAYRHAALIATQGATE